MAVAIEMYFKGAISGHFGRHELKALFPQCTVASTWHERLLSKSLDRGEPRVYGYLAAFRRRRDEFELLWQETCILP